MKKISSFDVSYDRGADVLYIGRCGGEASRAVEDPNGTIWRYGAREDVIGATVMDFSETWAFENTALVRDISSHFGVSTQQAEAVLADALNLLSSPA